MPTFPIVEAVPDLVTYLAALAILCAGYLYRTVRLLTIPPLTVRQVHLRDRFRVFTRLYLLLLALCAAGTLGALYALEKPRIIQGWNIVYTLGWIAHGLVILGALVMAVYALRQRALAVRG